METQPEHFPGLLVLRLQSPATPDLVTVFLPTFRLPTEFTTLFLTLQINAAPQNRTRGSARNFHSSCFALITSKSVLKSAPRGDFLMEPQTVRALLVGKAPKFGWKLCELRMIAKFNLKRIAVQFDTCSLQDYICIIKQHYESSPNAPRIRQNISHPLRKCLEGLLVGGFSSCCILRCGGQELTQVVSYRCMNRRGSMTFWLLHDLYDRMSPVEV